MTVFHLPDLGEGLTEAEIREWYVKVGDSIELDQPMVAMETAKAVVDVPAPQTGVIQILHGSEGDIVDTGAPLVTFEGEQAAQSSEDNATVVGNIEVGHTVLEESATGINKTTSPTSHTPSVKALPAARSLAKKLGINLEQIIGTGKGGTITPTDVNNAAQSDTSQAAQEGIELKGARRTMVSVMTDSHKHVVPATLFDEADITGWTDNEDISVRLIQAVSTAAAAVPAMNAHFNGESLTIQQYDTVNLGIAVDTQAGLFLPVINGVNTKNPAELREELNTLKAFAKANNFPPDRLKGATFILSNVGSIAGKYATPVVVPPMVAILAVGRIYAGCTAKDGSPALARLLPLSLTFDHRAITGGDAARFLAAFIEQLS